MEDLVARDANDGSILAGRLYELNNGCVCCTIKDDLAVTLEALLEERRLYTHIIIELTGLADPGSVASRVWLDDAMHSRLKLDGMRNIYVYSFNSLYNMSTSTLYILCGGGHMKKKENSIILVHHFFSMYC